MAIPTLIYCAGGNRRYAEIALRYGFRYGAQLPDTCYYPPYFADQDFHRPNYTGYVAALKRHRPPLASVLDWMDARRLDEIIDLRATEIARYTDEVMIIPKVVGGMVDLNRKLPTRTIGGKPVRLGYSVPTSHGKTDIDPAEFGDWPVHLLGGSPHDQLRYAPRMHVVSADGNYSQKLAKLGAFFSPVRIAGMRNQWYPQLQEMGLTHITTEVNHHAFTLSCINTLGLWKGSQCTVRYAAESDLPAIKTIANRYKAEVGYVMYPALREAIGRHELFVAEVERQIVGFVRYHRRLDGISTVHELAVDRTCWHGKVGTALLCAVPHPIRLKCPVDSPANTFYDHLGYTLIGIDPGKKRPLNIWSTHEQI